MGKAGQEEYLINYRKLVLMSQYTDVRALIMGQPLEKPYDPAIVAAVKNHPNYWPLQKRIGRGLKILIKIILFGKYNRLKQDLSVKIIMNFLIKCT